MKQQKINKSLFTTTTTNTETASSITLETLLKTVEELNQKKQKLIDEDRWTDYICFSDTIPFQSYTLWGKILRIIPTAVKKEILKLTPITYPSDSIYPTIGSIPVIEEKYAVELIQKDIDEKWEEWKKKHPKT